MRNHHQPEELSSLCAILNTLQEEIKFKLPFKYLFRQAFYTLHTRW